MKERINKKSTKFSYKNMIKVLMIVFIIILSIPHIQISADNDVLNHNSNAIEVIPEKKINVDDVINTSNEPVINESSIDNIEENDTLTTEEDFDTLPPQDEMIEEKQIIASGTHGADWQIYLRNDDTVLEIFAGRLDNFANPGLVPWFPYGSAITKVVINEGVIAPVDASYMFYGLYATDEFIGINNLNTENTQLTISMFEGMTNIKNLDLSSWNTELVTDMNCMFKGLINLTQLNISTWNTENVINMSHMFYNLNSLTQLDISGWDTKSVENMQWMFYNVHNLTTLDISRWNTESVKYMESMFEGTGSLQSLNLSDWDTSQVETMKNMFKNMYNLTSLELSTWNVEKVTKMDSMFENNRKLESLDLSGWKTPRLLTMSWMFAGMDTLNTLNISQFDTTNVHDMTQIFNEISHINQLILGENIRFLGDAGLPNITESGYSGRWIGLNTGTIFNSSEDLIANYEGQADVYVWEDDNIDQGYHGTWWRIDDIDGEIVLKISAGELDDFGDQDTIPWNDYLDSITKVVLEEGVIAPRNSGSMFEGLRYVTEIVGIDTLNISKVEVFKNMFAYLPSLKTLDIGNWNTENAIDMSNMFAVSDIEILDISTWDTKNVTNMSGMFFATKLETLDISAWDTKNVTNMNGMFCYTSIISLDISSWNTSRLETMSQMFEGTKNLETLNLSSWDTSKVESMESTFALTSLTSLDISNWSTESIKTMEYMFFDSDNLKQLSLGENFKFEDNAKLPAISAEGYTGKWMGVNTNTVFDSSTSFIENYDGEADTYVWQEDSISDNVAEGYHGTWWRIYDLEDERILEISAGELANFGNSEAIPWKKYQSSITKVVLEEGVIAPRVSSNMFENLENVTEIVGIESLNTDKVETFKSMFSFMTSLKSLDLTRWNTENVIDMSGMFAATGVETLDLSTWNTKKVNETSGMFFASSVTNLDLSMWNTSSLEYTSQMFDQTTNLETLNLSGWDTSKVKSMESTFASSNISSLDISNWSTESIQTMEYMLGNANNLKQLTLGENFKFEDNTNLPAITAEGYTGKWIGVNTRTIFNSSEDLIKKYDGEADTYIWEKESIDQGYHGTWWKVYDLEDQRILEISAGELADFGNFDIIPWKDYLDTITTVVLEDGIVAPKNSAYMFYGLNKTTIITGINTLNTDQVENFNNMFEATNSLKTLDLSNWNTENATDMSYMFYGASNLKSMNISTWNTENVTNMKGMFSGMHNLRNLDIMSWNTKNVLDMSFMFYATANLGSLDLSDWNVLKVASMDSMFLFNTNLETLNLSGWDIKNNTASVTMSNMFQGTANLHSLTLSENFEFRTGASLPTIHKVGYSGQWIGMKTGTKFNSSTDFMTNYDGEADTYVWQLKNIDSGHHGTWWRVYDLAGERILEISAGELDDFGSKDIIPWIQYLDTITKVDIKEGVVAPQNSAYMFAGLTHVSEMKGINGLDTSQVEDFNHMFSSMNVITELDLSNWDTSSAMNMSYMFHAIINLKTLSTTNWTTENVTDMKGMFAGAENIRSLDISNWDTSNVTDMSFMFYLTTYLNSLDLSGWNVLKVTTMDSMFFDSSKLTKLDLSGWDIKNNTESITMKDAFRGTTRLSELSIGENFEFKADAKLPTITKKGYTGQWMGLNTNTVFNSSTDFMTNYDGEADTYIWESNILSVKMPVSMLFESNEDSSFLIISEEYEVINKSNNRVKVNLASLSEVNDISQIQSLNLNSVSLIVDGIVVLEDETNLLVLEDNERDVLKFSGETQSLDSEVNPTFNMIFKFSCE